MIEGKYNRGGVNPPPSSKRPNILLTGMSTKTKVDNNMSKKVALEPFNTFGIFISPRKSDKEYKLIYEYFNILYPFGWVIYLEGANPPEVLLSGAGEFNTNKNFDVLKAKTRLQELQEEMLKLKEYQNE